eukprot:jgi/Botrbrau1/1628/Bobra.0185s0042.2
MFMCSLSFWFSDTGKASLALSGGSFADSSFPLQILNSCIAFPELSDLIEDQFFAVPEEISHSLCESGREPLDVLETCMVQLPDWHHINRLACIFDSLDIRRDASVDVGAFIGVLIGFSPSPAPVSEHGILPAESSEPQGPSTVPSLEGRTTAAHLPEGAVKRTQVYRKGRKVRNAASGTSTSERGAASLPHMRLKDNQLALIAKTNTEIDRMMALYNARGGEPILEGHTVPEALLQCVASCSGACHRLVFIEKLIHWRWRNAIVASAVRT